MRSATWVSGVLLVIGALTGCSRYTIHSDYDPAANFRGLQTYAWQPGAQRSVGDPRVNDAQVDSTVRRVVDDELHAKGFTKLTSGRADFLVDFSASVRDKSNTVNVGERYTSGGVWQTASWYADTAHYEEGVLVLGILDPQTGKLMWRGTAVGIFDPTASADTRDERISGAIRDLLKSFPPQRE
jgi:hypothetical protein